MPAAPATAPLPAPTKGPGSVAPPVPAAPPLGRSMRGPVAAGILVIALFFGAFLGWSALAPLASAAIAPGQVSPDGSRKTVQHLEGGIVREILVEDGSHVGAGEPLVVLADVQASASFELLASQYRTLAATRARLVAEQSGAPRLTFPDWLVVEAAADPDAADPESVAGILAAQARLFEVRAASMDQRRQILAQRIAQLVEEIGGLEAQIVSQDRQIELIQQEIRGVQQLVNQGLERQPRLLALQRAEADIAGERAGNVAAIARAGQAIGEAELQIIGLDTLRLDEIANELSAIQSEIATVGERLRASEDVLERTIITAPVGGTVVGLRFRTPGGVIGPGEAILDIVPDEDELLIDVRVSPLDIDVVHEGLSAQVVLSAYAQRNLPQIFGTVRHVSADALADPNTGESYFRARIEVDRDSLSALDADIELSPGMPAEVMIRTGERTVLDYLLEPFTDLMRRSMRET